MNSRIISWIFYSFLTIFTIQLLIFLQREISLGHWDKLAHFVGFFFITIVFRVLCNMPSWMILLCVSLYAGATELGHDWMPHRNGSLDDLYANLAGAGLAMILLKLFRLWRMYATRGVTNDSP